MLWPARGLESREAGEGQVTPVVLSSQGQSSFLLHELIPPVGQHVLSFSCKQNLTPGRRVRKMGSETQARALCI